MLYSSDLKVDKEPPRAPLLKDLDSFTEGSAVGSFNYSLDSGSKRDKDDEQVRIDDGAGSVAFSLDDPVQSIEIWRRDVISRTLLSSENELSRYGLMNTPSTSASRDSYPRKRRHSMDSTSEYRHILTLGDAALSHIHTASLFSVDCECAGSRPSPDSVDHTSDQYISRLSQPSQFSSCALPPL